MSDSPAPTSAETPADAAPPASFGQALRPIITILAVLALVVVAAWAMLKFVHPGISMLLTVAMAIMSTLGGIAIIVSAGDGFSHKDSRAQDFTGIALVLAMIGPGIALLTLLIIMF